MSLLQIQGVTKDFLGVRALDDVTFTVEPGEIHCLCGENGAGKSTLMKIISGVYPHGSYKGTVSYKDKPTHYTNVKQSEKAGISIIHQELALSPYLSIAENIFLGHEKTKLGVLLDEQHMIQKTRELLQRVKLNENPATTVNTLGVGKQQLVEIAKALSKDVQLLILDEPTSSLNDEDSESLLKLILELRREGIASIMISHKLNELTRIADCITVLRDGKTIATHSMREENPVGVDTIISEMVGRSLTQMFPKRSSRVGEKRFEVQEWSVYHPVDTNRVVIDNASMYACRGEVVGVCGLMGSGRTELMMSLFGGMYGSHHTGQLLVDGVAVQFSSPKNAIKNGMCYVSEDRKSLGLVLKQDVKNNISNSSLHLLSRYGVVQDHMEVNKARQYVESMKIKTPTIDTSVSTLSGGNQQKVVLSRCLMTSPDIFIIDEPTRGIDVGAKYEIYGIINALSEEGKTIIIVSSELPEILGMSDRIYVMNNGKIKGMLNAAEASQEKIMHIALSHAENEEERVL